MRGWRRAIGGLALWLCAASASAGADPFTAASVRRHLEAWPEPGASARDRASASLDAEAWARLDREVAAAFAPDALLAEVAASVSADDAEAAAIARGFRGSGASALLGPIDGIPVAELRDFPAFASGVAGGAVPPTRLLLIARVDDATGFSRNAWRVSTAVARAVARGARELACTPEDERGGWDDPVSDAQTGPLAALAPAFRERAQLELLFHARSRSGADLQRALRFLESEPVRVFHARLGAGIERALASATARVRDRIAPEVARRCER